MKKLFLTILIGLLSTVTYSQESVTYNEVVELDSTSTKNLIFQSVNTWFSTTYNSASSVIQMNDKDAGIIIGKGTMSYTYPGIAYTCYSGHINYTIKVVVKDGKYKVEISDFRHENLPSYDRSCELGLITTDPEYNGGPNMSKKYSTKVWVDIKTKIETYSQSLINNLEEEVKNNIDSDF